MQDSHISIRTNDVSESGLQFRPDAELQRHVASPNDVNSSGPIPPSEVDDGHGETSSNASFWSQIEREVRERDHQSR